MSNSSPSWTVDDILMDCLLLALDKIQGVLPMVISDTVLRALARIFMRAAGEPANTACKKLQLCNILEYGIEGETHAVRERRKER